MNLYPIPTSFPSPTGQFDVPALDPVEYQQLKDQVHSIARYLGPPPGEPAIGAAGSPPPPAPLPPGAAGSGGDGFRGPWGAPGRGGALAAGGTVSEGLGRLGGDVAAVQQQVAAMVEAMQAAGIAVPGAGAGQDGMGAAGSPEVSVEMVLAVWNSTAQHRTRAQVFVPVSVSTLFDSIYPMSCLAGVSCPTHNTTSLPTHRTVALRLRHLPFAVCPQAAAAAARQRNAISVTPGALVMPDQAPLEGPQRTAAGASGGPRMPCFTHNTTLLHLTLRLSTHYCLTSKLRASSRP